MEKALALFKKITLRQWGALYALGAAAVVAAAFISQSFGFNPCKLCIWQRYPYGIVAVLAAALFFLHDKKAAKFLLLPIAAASLYNAGLAFFHVGVEYHWWTFASDCVATNVYKEGATVEEMLAALKAAPIVRCDERVPFLFGMTMAFYNVLISAGMGVVALLVFVKVKK